MDVAWMLRMLRRRCHEAAPLPGPPTLPALSSMPGPAWPQSGRQPGTSWDVLTLPGTSLDLLRPPRVSWALMGLPGASRGILWPFLGPPEPNGGLLGLLGASTGRLGTS